MVKPIGTVLSVDHSDLDHEGRPLVWVEITPIGASRGEFVRGRVTFAPDEHHPRDPHRKDVIDAEFRLVEEKDA